MFTLGLEVRPGGSLADRTLFAFARSDERFPGPCSPTVAAGCPAGRRSRRSRSAAPLRCFPAPASPPPELAGIPGQYRRCALAVGDGAMPWRVVSLLGLGDSADRQQR